MKNEKINILSLFAGGGFLDLGFINQGFEIREAVELNPYFIQAYNFGLGSYFKKSNNHYVRNKIVNHNAISGPVDASCLDEQKRLEAKHFGITGIIGGPPCQDYSVGGKNGGIEGERGRLIYSYLSIVRRIQPTFLFFENVEGLYKTRRHRQAFDAFVEDIRQEGYVVWHDLLNVLEYGFAQDRPRIALIAFKKGLVEKLVQAGFKCEFNNHILKHEHRDDQVFRWPKPTFIRPKSLNWPKKWSFRNRTKKYPMNGQTPLCVETAFKGLTLKTPNQDEHFQPKSSKFYEIEEGDTNRKSFKRLHRFRYSPTVAYGNNEVHLHPTKARRLTVREGLRLQTVPDTYILPKEMPLTPKFKLISNGVPTAKAELIAQEIRRTLDNYGAIT